MNDKQSKAWAEVVNGLAIMESTMKGLTAATVARMFAPTKVDPGFAALQRASLDIFSQAAQKVAEQIAWALSLENNGLPNDQNQNIH